jgi:proteic killer suppression protein
LKRFPADVLKRASQKLDYLNGASDLVDLEAPPGNRLELLKGDLKGFHSIRVNDQWRIVFQWQGSDAHQVRLVDYHR